MLNSRWHFPICNKLVLHRSSKLILELRNILANPIFLLSAIICWQQFPVVILEINSRSISAVKILLFCFDWNLRTNLGPLKWVSSLSNVYRYWWGSESWKNAVNIATWWPATRQQHLNFLNGSIQNTLPESLMVQWVLISVSDGGDSHISALLLSSRQLWWLMPSPGVGVTVTQHV